MEGLGAVWEAFLGATVAELALVFQAGVEED